MRVAPNISWLDYSRTRGYWVRFFRGPAGAQRVISKFFTVRKHEPKAPALRAAMLWRDQMAPTLPKLARPGPRVGHGYVKRTTIQHRSGNTSPVFVGWVRLEDGRSAQTSRSIPLHGARDAKEQTRRWLRRKRREIRQRLEQL